MVNKTGKLYKSKLYRILLLVCQWKFLCVFIMKVYMCVRLSDKPGWFRADLRQYRTVLGNACPRSGVTPPKSGIAQIRSSSHETGFESLVMQSRSSGRKFQMVIWKRSDDALSTAPLTPIGKWQTSVNCINNMLLNLPILLLWNKVKSYLHIS